MNNKKITKIIIGASIALLLVSTLVLIKKTWSATGILRYWCNYNSSCSTITDGCTCPTGTVSPTSCPAGYTAPSGSDASTDCKQNCAASTVSGYSVPALNSGSSTSVSKPPCYRTEGGQYTATATCNDGVVSITNQSALSCFTNYKYTYGSWYENTYGCYYVCVSNVCPAGSIDGYDYPQLAHYGSVGDSKTITGGSCSATIFCADGGVTVQNESCTCNAGYYDNNGTCTTCTAGYYCTGNNVRTECPANMTSSAGSDAQGDCYCKNLTWTSCVYPTCNPAKYTGYKYCNCDGLILVAYPSVNNGCEVSYYHSNEYLKACSTICCGDGSCESAVGETPYNCEADCGYCGDGICSSVISESCSSCPEDCGGCSCYDNYSCDTGETCCGALGTCTSYDYWCDTPETESECYSCGGSWYYSSPGSCCLEGACYGDPYYGYECYAYY